MSHNYEHRNYIILPVAQLNLIDFSQVLETSADTVRKSLDGTKTFVKWDSGTPSCIASLTNIEGPYNYTEITGVLSTAEWCDPNMEITRP